MTLNRQEKTRVAGVKILDKIRDIHTDTHTHRGDYRVAPATKLKRKLTITNLFSVLIVLMITDLKTTICS